MRGGGKYTDEIRLPHMFIMVTVVWRIHEDSLYFFYTYAYVCLKFSWSIFNMSDNLKCSQKYESKATLTYCYYKICVYINIYKII